MTQQDPTSVSARRGRPVRLLLLVTAVCLALNFGGRLLEKRGIADALISSGAFLLLALTQRFTGPLAALGLDSPAAFVVATVLAAV